MAYSIWEPSHAYSYGDVVAAIPEDVTQPDGDVIGQRPINGYGLVFRCIVAGTSAATEPSWPSETYKTTTVDGVTSPLIGYVDDNTVRWAAISAVHADLQAIYPSSIIEMFELELNQLQHDSTEVLRFHAGTNLNLNTELMWQGNLYRPLPIEAEGFEYSGSGQLPRPRIRVSNLYLIISTALAELPYGLEGAKLTRIRTLARYLDTENFPADAFILQEDGGIFLTEDSFKISTEDGQNNPLGTPDPLAEFPREVYYVDRKSLENRDIVEFELASVFDLQNMRIPRRQTIANICQWKYRNYDATTSGFNMAGVTCPYVGTQYYTVSGESTLDPAQDVCNKQLDGCRLRFASIELNGYVTSGSTQLPLIVPGQGSAVGSGMPIKGFGLQDNTIITGYIAASGIVQLSLPAVKTNPFTVTGTLVNKGLQLNVSVADAAKVAPGMTVTGSGIPDSVTVRSINYGTGAITLSLSYNPLGFSIYAQTNGSISNYTNEQGNEEAEIFLDNNPSLTSGMEVTSQGTYVDDYGVTRQYATYANTTINSEPEYISPVGKWRVLVNKPQGFSGDFVFTFSTVISRPASSYTFTSTTSYFARGSNPSLPFGGFPGVGAYKV